MNVQFIILATSTVALSVSMLLYALLRRGSAATRHAILLLGLGSAVCTPLFSLLLPRIELPVLQSSGQATFELSANPASDTAGPLANSGAFSSRTVTNYSRFSALGGLFWVSLALWAIGASVSLARFVAAVFAARRLARSSSALVESAWLGEVAFFKKMFCLRNPIALAITSKVVPPMTWGIFRPIILLPATALAWPVERRRLVVAHELAHVKRRDALTQFAARIVCVLYWFNPLAWMLAARLRIEQERAADDMVLNTGADACNYAEHLLEVARAASGTSLISQATIAMAEPSHLEARLNHVMNRKQNRRTLTRFRVAMLICSGFVLMLSIATIRLTAMPVPLMLRASVPPPVSSETVSPARLETRIAAPNHETSAIPQLLNREVPYTITEEERRASENVTQAEQAVYERWPEEDVLYIITDEERQAFQSLVTDAERERFIEQFWLRRDPTPGTQKNEFREEHYERIAFVNRRFAWLQAGWRSDRGRIYIQHGKPDEIESHPASGTYIRPDLGSTVTTYPFEVWTYRAIGGVQVTFEFVDNTLTGEYRLSQIYKRNF